MLRCTKTPEMNTRNRVVSPPKNNIHWVRLTSLSLAKGLLESVWTHVLIVMRIRRRPVWSHVVPWVLSGYIQESNSLGSEKIHSARIHVCNPPSSRILHHCYAILESGNSLHFPRFERKCRVQGCRNTPEMNWGDRLSELARYGPNGKRHID